jgi:hypothetical protein
MPSNHPTRVDLQSLLNHLYCQTVIGILRDRRFFHNKKKFREKKQEIYQSKTQKLVNF